MELKDLTKEQLDQLERVMFHSCPNNDLWADMMYLGGAGDEGSYDFPFDLDQIESIDISMVGAEEYQESTSEPGSEAESKVVASEEMTKDAGLNVGANVGVNVNVSGVAETVGTVGGILKDTAKKVKDTLH